MYFAQRNPNQKLLQGLNAFVITDRCQKKKKKIEENTPACTAIKKTDELDQKLSGKLRWKISASLKANRGLRLHCFSTNEREGEQRGETIYWRHSIFQVSQVQGQDWMRNTTEVYTTKKIGGERQRQILCSQNAKQSKGENLTHP